ncbi:MAG: hypothetical protein WC707_00255 [Candidatus Babeliaceae bacterium]|jgi:response regulator RpfG family c-di-GMP phosphodiesterase
MLYILFIFFVAYGMQDNQDNVASLKALAARCYVQQPIHHKHVTISCDVQDILDTYAPFSPKTIEKQYKQALYLNDKKRIEQCELYKAVAHKDTIKSHFNAGFQDDPHQDFKALKCNNIQTKHQKLYTIFYHIGAACSALSLDTNDP